MRSQRLAGKVVVIIGGTSGLGLSAACACVDAGAAVVAVGLPGEACDQAAQLLSSKGLVMPGDARDPETAPGAIQKAGETWGGFDALYHVAGGSGRSQGDGPLDAATDAGWEYTIDLNLKTVFFSNRAAVRQFLRQGSGGSILNLSSVLAYSPSPRYFATHAYATAKSAILGLTKAAAAYYADRGIRFNVIAPALVDTPMARRATSNEQIVRYVKSKQVLDGGRVGRPQDLDDAVIYFLSDESRFVTGQILAIDGGWSVSEGRADEHENP